MAFVFSGPTKVITLTSGTTAVSVRDLWSRWVDWFLTGDNSKYAPAFVNVGGDDIDVSAGTKIPIYAFLMNGWKIKPQEANHTLTVVDGILLVNGGGDPFSNTSGAYTVRINYQQPVQAISFATGGGGATPAQIAEAVWVELTADGSTTTGEALLEILRHGKNRWKIDNNQLTIYADDGTTPMRVFDLKDASGNPTETSPYERVPL